MVNNVSKSGSVLSDGNAVPALDVLRGYPAKALVSEFYQGLDTDDQAFVSAIHGVVGPSFEYPDYSWKTVGSVVKAVEKNIASVAMYAATYASLDLMAEAVDVGNALRIPFTELPIGQEFKCERDLHWKKITENGITARVIQSDGVYTLGDESTFTYKDIVSPLVENMVGIAPVELVPVLNDKYAESIIGEKAYQFYSLSIVGMRDLNGGVESEGTQYEVDYHNPEIYSVYAHFQEACDQPPGSLCVGDMATHQLAWNYASELAWKYGFVIEDRSKAGPLAKESETKSLVLAQTIAQGKNGSFAFLDTKTDQSHVCKVIGVTDAHVVLSLGRSAAIVAQSDLSRVPVMDETVTVSFKGGKGAVSECALGKGAGVGR